METIKIKTQDNVEIAADYYKNGKNRALIIAPGWCMTKGSKAFKLIAEAFGDNFDILLMDFRGHGKSRGFFTFTAKEYLDIEACVDFLSNKNYEEINAIGFSLGAASVLIYQGYGVKEKGLKSLNKIITVSAPDEFNKIENKMWKKEAWGETFCKTFGRNAGKYEFIRFLTIRPAIIPEKKIKPVDIVENINIPTLFIAGKKDPTVDYCHTIRVFEKAKCEKDLKLYEKGIHAEDIFLHFSDDFIKTCIDWLKS